MNSPAALSIRGGLVTVDEEMCRWQENREMPLVCALFLSALQAVTQDISKGLKGGAALAALASVVIVAEQRSMIGIDPKKLDSEAA